MVLAGDVGGTKTQIGLFDPVPARPRAITVRTFVTAEYASLIDLIAAFLDKVTPPDNGIESACFGVAGPVVGHAASLTNVDWQVDAHQIARSFAIPQVALLNDLQAMAHSVTVLQEREVHTLQAGEALRGGNIALIAAGTGLGQALLHYVNGQFVPSPSEGGHADFAARTAREVALMNALTARIGRAEIEQVISGMGIVNIHRVTHDGRACRAIDNLDSPDAPAMITLAALEQHCPDCVEALDLFVEAYGAETGNLALRSVATGGVFIGGGIAPKILRALTDGRFMRAFLAKQPFEEMLRRMPVKVILHPEAGLLGAAVYAAAVS